MALHKSIPQGRPVSFPKAVPAARWLNPMPMTRMAKNGVSASRVGQRDRLRRWPYTSMMMSATAVAPIGSKISGLMEMIPDGLLINVEIFCKTKESLPPMTNASRP